MKIPLDVGTRQAIGHGAPRAQSPGLEWCLANGPEEEPIRHQNADGVLEFCFLFFSPWVPFEPSPNGYPQSCLWGLWGGPLGGHGGAFGGALMNPQALHPALAVHVHKRHKGARVSALALAARRSGICIKGGS